MSNTTAPGQDKALTIIVNTVPKQWTEKKISFKEVVVLAFGTYKDDPKITYTVEYFKGPQDKHEGTLTKGESVPVKDGMVFNVAESDQS